MVQFLVFVAAMTVTGAALMLIVETLRASADTILAALAGEPRVANVQGARRTQVRRVMHPRLHSPLRLRAAA